MRPGLIKFLLPYPDDCFGIVERWKVVDTETFVPEPAIEGFDEPVSPGLLGWDKH